MRGRRYRLFPLSFAPRRTGAHRPGAAYGGTADQGCPYAYYSLDAQKQMQQDLRDAGSLVFFEQDEDTLPEPDEAVGLINLPDALSEADQMIETGDADFHNKTETVLGRVMPKSW
jgi:hypothetical protein